LDVVRCGWGAFLAFVELGKNLGRLDGVLLLHWQCAILGRGPITASVKIL
jgi:hypothetical protein